jgi:hypothetical protein
MFSFLSNTKAKFLEEQVFQETSNTEAQFPEEQQVFQETPQSPLPQSYCNHLQTSRSSNGSVKELTFGSSVENEIVGMVVTMCSGSTYDGVFKSIEQKAGEGERVAVYSCMNVTPTKLLEGIQHGVFGEDAVLQKMLAEIACLEPGTVVFNWECCSGFSNDRFVEDDQNNPTIILMAYLLEKGFMVQCCDFSAGALIKCWDKKYLGSNPFIKAGTFSDQVTLKFDSDYLKQNEDSAQLQMVGELCKGGATLHALGGTVAFTVDKKVKPAKWDSVEVLTVATRLGDKDASAFPPSCCSTKSGLSGMAGHAIVRYPSGGRLLVGCPHWIELSNVNVKEDHLLKVAEKRYGTNYASEMKTKLMSASICERQQMCDSLGGEFIKQSAPQKYKSSSKWY